MRYKKGQESLGISTLIGLIAFFIVVYIILIPPAERERLLNITDEKTPEKIPFTGESLLTASPGQLAISMGNKKVHEIPALDLFIKTKPEITNIADYALVSKSLASTNTKEFSFEIEDLNKLDKVLMTFSVKNPSGNLIIELNNQKFFEKKYKEAKTEVITLPLNLIKKQNKVKIDVSSPGLAFWKTNSYELNNLNIKRVFTLENLKEERIFSISSSEKLSAEESRLKFFTYCNSPIDSDSVLNIKLNNRAIFSGTLFCGSENNIDTPVNYLNDGLNSLIFEINKGDYTISPVKFETVLGKKLDYLYNFNVNQEQFNLIEKDKSDVILYLNLEGDRKRAELVVNGNSIFIDTEDSLYSEDISDLIIRGANYIKIIPKNSFGIPILEVKLV